MLTGKYLRRTNRSISVLGFLSSIVFVQQVFAVPNQVTRDNPADWKHFQPFKFSHPELLVPSPAMGGPNLQYKDAPSFPDDPKLNNVIYGRGKDELPTTIYAPGYSPVLIGGKTFIVPKAGQSEAVKVNSQPITLWGTTCYTPIADFSYIANPAQLSPFAPGLAFYLDRTAWPSHVYGEPGSPLQIGKTKTNFPEAGRSQTLSVKDDKGASHRTVIIGLPRDAIQPNSPGLQRALTRLSASQSKPLSRGETNDSRLRKMQAPSAIKGPASAQEASAKGKGAGGARGRVTTFPRR